MGHRPAGVGELGPAMPGSRRGSENLRHDPRSPAAKHGLDRVTLEELERIRALNADARRCFGSCRLQYQRVWHCALAP